MPNIVKVLLLRSAAISFFLLAASIGFFVNGGVAAAGLPFLLFIYVFANMSRFYVRYRAGKVKACLGMCIRTEKQGSKLGKIRETKYAFSMSFPELKGTDEDGMLVYLTPTKKEVFNMGSTYEFVFWGDVISQDTLIGYIPYENHVEGKEQEPISVSEEDDGYF